MTVPPSVLASEDDAEDWDARELSEYVTPDETVRLLSTEPSSSSVSDERVDRLQSSELLMVEMYPAKKLAYAACRGAREVMSPTADRSLPTNALSSPVRKAVISLDLA